MYITLLCVLILEFLTARVTYDRKYVGQLARAAGAIPVSRPQDCRKKGIGTVYSSKDGKFVFPSPGTILINQIKSGDSITLNAMDNGQYSWTGVVHKVDTESSMTDSHEALLLKELLQFKILGKTTIKPEMQKISTNPSLTPMLPTKEVPFSITPRLDHSTVYEQVWSALSRGECIGIFPEGGSHDQPNLLELKAGVTIMALGWLAQQSTNSRSSDLKIIPCGLNYFNPHRFRSHVYIEFDEAITIPSQLVEQYRQGGEEKRKACQILLTTLTNALHQVTLGAPDFDTLRACKACARLAQVKPRKSTAIERLKIARRFAKVNVFTNRLIEIFEIY